METFALLSVGLFSFTLFSGIFIYSRDRGSNTNRIFLLLSLELAVWFFSGILLYSAQDKETAMNALRWGSTGIMLFVPTLFYFTVCTTAAFRCKYALPVFSPFLVIAIRNLYVPIFFSDAILTGGQLRLVPALSSAWHIIYSCCVFFCVPASIFLFFRWHQRSMLLREKRQAKTMGFALLIWFMVIVSEEIILPAFTRFTPGLAPLTFVIASTGIGYAIFRYRFLDQPVALAADRILDVLEELVLVLDNRYAVIRSNPQANLLGGPNLVVRAPFPDLINDGQAFRNLCRDLFLQKIVIHNFRFRFIHGDNPPLIDGRITLLRDDFGDPVAVLVTGREVRMEAFISRFKISPRELGIILEILADRTIREIADRLCISELTVKSHITHIYTKTGCVSRIKLLELLREYQISP